jgi:hypothetical protein
MGEYVPAASSGFVDQCSQFVVGRGDVASFAQAAHGAAGSDFDPVCAGAHHAPHCCPGRVGAVEHRVGQRVVGKPVPGSEVWCPGVAETGGW